MWKPLTQSNLSGNKNEPPNEVFCIAPWTHTFISPQSERRLCCASREKSSFIQQYIDLPGNSGTEYKPRTLEEHWNSDTVKKVRLKMLKGEIPEECQVCNDKILNLSPYRDWFNKALFPHKISEALEKTDETGATTMSPISFDYRVVNDCNFKCRMCGEQLSSSWEIEKRTHNEWSPQNDPWMIPEINRQIDLFQREKVVNELRAAIENKTIEEMYWVGGEPLVWTFHWEMMRRMIELDHAKNVFARYNTNLSRIKFKDDHLFADILPHFKNYLICASIDGAGKIGEFIRTGLSWEKWKSNFLEGLHFSEKIGKRDSMKMDITLTLPGLFSLKDLVQEALDFKVDVITKIVFAFDPQVVLSPLALPRPLLEEVIDENLKWLMPRSDFRTKSVIDSLNELKARKTFQEEWPNEYQLAFERGRNYQRKLGERRGDGKEGRLTLEEIYSTNKGVYEWWTKSDVE